MRDADHETRRYVPCGIQRCPRVTSSFSKSRDLRLEIKSGTSKSLKLLPTGQLSNLEARIAIDLCITRPRASLGSLQLDALSLLFVRETQTGIHSQTVDAQKVNICTQGASHSLIAILLRLAWLTNLYMLNANCCRNTSATVLRQSN